LIAGACVAVLFGQAVHVQDTALIQLTASAKIQEILDQRSTGHSKGELQDFIDAGRAIKSDGGKIKEILEKRSTENLNQDDVLFLTCVLQNEELRQEANKNPFNYDRLILITSENDRIEKGVGYVKNGANTEVVQNLVSFGFFDPRRSFLSKVDQIIAATVDPAKKKIGTLLEEAAHLTEADDLKETIFKALNKAADAGLTEHSIRSIPTSHLAPNNASLFNKYRDILINTKKLCDLSTSEFEEYEKGITYVNMEHTTPDFIIDVVRRCNINGDCGLKTSHHYVEPWWATVLHGRSGWWPISASHKLRTKWLNGVLKAAQVATVLKAKNLKEAALNPKKAQRGNSAQSKKVRRGKRDEGKGAQSKKSQRGKSAPPIEGVTHQLIRPISLT